MYLEEEVVLKEEDFDPVVREKIGRYKENVVRKINKFVEGVPNGLLLKNPNSQRLFKVNVIKHHLYKIEVLQDHVFKSIVLNADLGSEAIEVNKKDKKKKEYLGLVERSSSGGSSNMKINLSKIRIMGSFENFKIRLDSIANEIINSLPYTMGS